MTASSVCLDEHAAVNKVIVILDGLCGHLRDGKDPDAGDWPKVVEFLSVFVDSCHFVKEEQWLFPALREVADEETHQLIRRLLGDHGSIDSRRLACQGGRVGFGEKLKTMERAGDRPYSSYKYKYVDVFRPHIVTEAILFPLADQVLAEETQKKTLRKGYDRIERDIDGPGRYEGFQVMLQGGAIRGGPTLTLRVAGGTASRKGSCRCRRSDRGMQGVEGGGRGQESAVGSFGRPEGGPCHPRDSADRSAGGGSLGFGPPGPREVRGNPAAGRAAWSSSTG